MVSILKRVVGRKREAVCVAEPVQYGRALEDGELDQVVGGFGLGLPMVGPQALSLSTMTAGPNLSSGSLVGPLGLFPSSVAPGVGLGVGVVNAGTLSGGFSAFTGGGSDRGEP
jgi:hypothetical protein